MSLLTHCDLVARIYLFINKSKRSFRVWCQCQLQ